MLQRKVSRAEMNALLLRALQGDFFKTLTLTLSDRNISSTKRVNYESEVTSSDCVHEQSPQIFITPPM